jgi:hypothetical protein
MKAMQCVRKGQRDNSEVEEGQEGGESWIGQRMRKKKRKQNHERANCSVVPCNHEQGAPWADSRKGETPQRL